MDRLACVDLPALPLQLLLRDHPDWGDRPAAVVDKDKPQGLILWVNQAARRYAVLPGLRYAAGLSLCADLRAGVVPAAAIEKEVDALAERLRRHAPGVEPCAGEPGVFWLDARGIARLHASPAAWARGIRADLASLGLAAAVVVGFGRFASYALARTLANERVRVLATPAAEDAAARRVPLALVGLEPAAREALARLGVRTVGDFVRLPAAGIARRYGAATHRLHRLASGDLAPPLDPRPPLEPHQARLDLDDAEADVTRLTFLLKQLLDELLGELARRGEALAALGLRLSLDHAATVETSLRPAEPTLDGPQLVGLLRLRLDSLKLAAGVTTILLDAEGTPARPEQLELFARQRARRDPAAAARAFARLRAAFGEDAVVRARLASGHLPEASFAWEPIDKLPPAAPREVARRSVVRRLYARPTPLTPRERREPDGWLIRGLEHGPVARLVGPYLISGGWWRTEIQRDYYFAELARGDLLWVYYDRRRRRWFLQGEVT